MEEYSVLGKTVIASVEVVATVIEPEDIGECNVPAPEIVADSHVKEPLVAPPISE